EGVLARLLRGRIAVGDDHLREGRAIEDRAFLAVVLITKIIERQPLAAIEADDEAPFLPADAVAFNVKTRPRGLRDLERLDVVARLGYAIGGVIALLRR